MVRRDTVQQVRASQQLEMAAMAVRAEKEDNLGELKTFSSTKSSGGTASPRESADRKRSNSSSSAVRPSLKQALSLSLNKEKRPSVAPTVEDSDFFRRINQDGDSEVDIFEFTTGIEDMSSLLKKFSADRQTCNVVWRDVLEDDRVTTLRLAFCFVQIFMTALYGLNTIVDDHHLDIGLSILLLVFVLEIVFGIWVYGLDEFFNYEKYNVDVKFVGQANRMEAMFCIFAVIVFVFASATGEYACNPIAGGCVTPLKDVDPVGYEESGWFRISFAISSLRLLTLLQTTRYMVAILFKILPRFIPFLLNLWMFMSLYATYGVLLYNEGFDRLPEDDQPDASFEDYFSAILALFELLIGNAWTDTMYAVMKVHGLMHMWYFVTYIFIVTLLYCNLFLGILLDAFATFLEMNDEAQEEMNKASAQGMDQVSLDKDLAQARNRAFRLIS